ncbi:hypothetical protein D3C77_524970 [compost metagenome]
MLVQGTTSIQSWHDKRDLDRIEQHIVIAHLAKAVPISLWLQQPIPGIHLLHTLDLRWLPDTEPPVISSNVLTQIGHRPAKAQGLVKHLLHQRMPGRALHHRRSHIQRGQDAVLR